MSSSQLCALPKTGLSAYGRTLFVSPCATDLFFDSVCHCASQQHGIHYPSGISTLAETEHVIKHSSTFIMFLFAGTRRAHYHILMLALQIPPSSHVQLENDWIWGFSRVIWSSVLLRRISSRCLERESQILIYVRQFVERFGGAVLGICKTWAAAIHYVNSWDLDPWVGIMLTHADSDCAVWATDPNEAVAFSFFLRAVACLIISGLI